MRRARASLIASVAIGLLAVTTAGVSTWAWFQTNSAASVETEGDEVEITAVAPDDIELGAAEFYSYNGNGANGYTGSISSSATIASNFTLVSAASITTIPVPGNKMTFAVKVSSTNSINITNVDLQIISYSTVEKTNRLVVNNDGTGIEQISSVNKYVKIEEAIDIYAHVNSTGTFGTEGTTDGFQFDYANPFNKSTTNLSLVPSSERTVTGSTTVYAFFTIVFSNDNTTFYKEFKQHGDSSYLDDLYTTPANDDNPRYFHKETTGNSSCYEGMSFTLTNIKIVVS